MAQVLCVVIRMPGFELQPQLFPSVTLSPLITEKRAAPLPGAWACQRDVNGSHQRQYYFPLSFSLLNFLHPLSHLGFPSGANGKEPVCQCRKSKRLWCIGSQRVRHDWSDLACKHLSPLGMPASIVSSTRASNPGAISDYLPLTPPRLPVTSSVGFCLRHISQVPPSSPTLQQVPVFRLSPSLPGAPPFQSQTPKESFKPLPAWIHISLTPSLA